MDCTVLLICLIYFRIQSNGNELVAPVVLYMMCYPDTSTQAPSYRQELWATLLSLPDPHLMDMCIPWLQVRNI